MKMHQSCPWEEIVRDYEGQLKADGKAQNSIGTYLLAVRQFVETVKDANGTNDINQKTVNKWLTTFNPRKATLNLKKNALRSFLNFLKAERGFKQDIRIAIKDLPRPEPQFLEVSEMDRLLQYVKGKGETHPHYVLLTLMAFSAMRISEVLGIRFSDFENNTITLRESKHGGTRRKRLKTSIARMLKVYVNARRQKYPLNELPSASEDFIFMTKYAGKFQPYSRQAVNKFLKKYAMEIGLTKKISCHTLRHSFSVRYLSRGGSLRSLQTYLGHKDLKTTAIYLHATNEQLLEELERL